MPAWTERNWDHERDLRKHEPRPTDKLPPLPLHVQAPPIAGALEIAILAQSVPLMQAAELIEQYARTEAAAARVDATAAAIDRVCTAIEAHGATNAQA
ncbi:hypothetical protein [Bradyrhizobium lablabi]|uniref:Uncharacterized protein n=1 Tax=Bradyrhizobium lablabi TaxID=722472 RepID=A0A1H5JIZ2_9BRAD|nr:hypothetical protein [Bradyrhizobium lablabi]SEE52525.1 hypothetical protein SAMN05444171_7854 [Bradyrhizobium lablabi]SEE79347.1 hypothetical protein SAMN05444171_8084 [Bradyrhizobium lablabi]